MIAPLLVAEMCLLVYWQFANCFVHWLASTAPSPPYWTVRGVGSHWSFVSGSVAAHSRRCWPA